MSTVEQLNQTVGKLPAPQQLEVLQFAELLVAQQPARHLDGPAREPEPSTENPRIVIDPASGLPALTAVLGAPVLTSEMVRKMLEDFP